MIKKTLYFILFLFFFLTCRTLSVRSEGISPKGNGFCNSFQFTKIQSPNEIKLYVLKQE